MSIAEKSVAAVMLRWISTHHLCFAAEPPQIWNIADSEPPAGVQVVKPLRVRVLGPEGQPVAGALVTPWALRSSQGHGWWRADDDPAGVEPKATITNEDGLATVAYPYFRDVEEGTRTIGVSIYVDHRDFAFPDAIHIRVPREEPSPYEVKLVDGVRVNLRPSILGQPADTDNLFVFWSDGRSWQSSDSMERTAKFSLRLPPLRPGSHSVLVAKLGGDHVTHFSEIVDFEVSAKDRLHVDLALKPAQRIEGILSENVPRPVTNGRIKLETLAPSGENDSRVKWFSWAPIRPDGTFTIEGWPAGETIQLIALCDGFIGKSGKAPAAVANPHNPAHDPFKGPQVFDPSDQQPITAEMEPLVKCVVTTVDEDNKPVAGITVVSCPNVGWWNGFSQIYCHPLVRCERLLRIREYHSCIDNDVPPPFEATTDGSGRATLELPAGKERLTLRSDRYELPAFLGSREVLVELVAGRTAEITLRLQPKGTERLGEWDKLAGVVFGCSTREGRPIYPLPAVRKKMDEVTKRFAEAKNQRDPKLLAETYTIIAEAFADVNDLQEAAKWREKAAVQAARAEAGEK